MYALSAALVRTRFKSRVELLEDLLPAGLEVHLEIRENPCREAVSFPDQAKEDVFGPHIGMMERLGLLGSDGEHLLDSRSVGNLSRDFAFTASAPDLLLDCL